MTADLPAEVLDVIRRTWGFADLRPLQAEAIRAGLDGRDSLVVLPTGGGKSLCYQVPPLVTGRMDVVVSPLISLMKDQVDDLRANGYPAVALHSGLSADERRRAEEEVASGACRLIFAAPERLLLPHFLDRLERIGVRAFAIDEAHCISHWGHDFRPDYLGLSAIKERFPEASVHGYTATATPRVREDVVTALGLRDPAVLVGRFDRPNLVYRIVPRLELHRQVEEVLARHEKQAVIVYAITRRETESLAGHLRRRGHRAAHYHAGMEPEERRRAQDDFAAERVDVVVATVAFGMGIDRSNVRCVLHTAMPKSIEHYQQETGRAGRDGLEAECVLLYSAADVIRWRALLEREAGREGADRPADERHVAAETLLEHMRRFCAPGRCRHAALTEYFGQAYEEPGCGACDTCLGEAEELEDGTEAAQKILSCVARTGERFGVGHVVDVLRGADTERVRTLGHDALSTHGILKDAGKKELTSQVYQLIDQNLLERTSDEFPVLRLNERSWQVLRGEREVPFVPTKRKKKVRRTKVETESWEGVDRELFEALRDMRRAIAGERGVPAYVVFTDATLRDLARIRPRSPEEMLSVHGIGEKKLADHGERVLALIAEHVGDDAERADPVWDDSPLAQAVARKSAKGRSRARGLFVELASVEEVAVRLECSVEKAVDHLVDHIRETRPGSIRPWVADEAVEEIGAAARSMRTPEALRLHDALHGRRPLAEIRIVLAFLGFD
jgi:ATP-dependent DNA helicase RecQ